ncbi:MAG TPA: quinol:cytochrome C oxidoreductase [Pirellulaceae bacterium]|jgi:hypothetical protein|nr:quinol:cytochrome C oxidoreductase [Pirellulaceae bacterium]
MVKSTYLPLDERTQLASQPAIAFGAIGLAALIVLIGAALSFSGGEAIDLGEGRFSRTSLSDFMASYLINFWFLLTLGLGGLFFTMVQHLTRAGWSATVRRTAEFLAASLIPTSLLFIPIAIVVLMRDGTLYPWTDPELVAHDPLLEWKEPYLNVFWFLVRAVAYIAVWVFLAWRFVGQSLKQDETGDFRITYHLQSLAAPAMFLFGLTLTFAAVDWIMTLAPVWFSTMWGVYLFAGTMVSTCAALILLVSLLHQFGKLRGIVNVEHTHDLSKLLFGFIVFWGYIAFSQYMLIWYANIPEETFWYRFRQENEGWVTISAILLVGHLLLPLPLLLRRSLRRNAAYMTIWAVFMLIMHWIDLYWMIAPQFRPEAPYPGVMDFALLLAAVAYLAGFLFFMMGRYPLAPLKDPRLHEALAFKNL